MGRAAADIQVRARVAHGVDVAARESPLAVGDTGTDNHSDADEGREMVVTDGDVTKAHVERIFADLAKCHEDDLIVITWSGHGAPLTLANGRDTGFLVPVDAPHPLDVSNAMQFIGMKELGRWALKDAEHWLCECNKYCRTLLGEEGCARSRLRCPRVLQQSWRRVSSTNRSSGPCGWRWGRSGARLSARRGRARPERWCTCSRRCTTPHS